MEVKETSKYSKTGTEGTNVLPQSITLSKKSKRSVVNTRPSVIQSIKSKAASKMAARSNSSLIMDQKSISVINSIVQSVQGGRKDKKNSKKYENKAKEVLDIAINPGKGIKKEDNPQTIQIDDQTIQIDDQTI